VAGTGRGAGLGESDVSPWRLRARSLLPAYLFLGAIGAALTLIDLDVQRLPDLIVFVLLLVPIMVTGSVGCAAAGCAGR
jgi:hypothetical protein